MRERILHVALHSAQEKNPAIERAWRKVGDYLAIDWCAIEAAQGTWAVGPTVTKAAVEFQPTIIYMQLHREVMRVSDIAAIRFGCPGAVIINWDGDQYFEPQDPERAWFIELGRVVDISLVANTEHPAAYANMGVRNAGFMSCGYDELIYRPTSERVSTPPIIMLAQNYPHLANYRRRASVIERLADVYPGSVAVYGGGWEGKSYGRPWVSQWKEAPLYASAELALSMSIRNDLACCTSGRLYRALGSGACLAVERFPDMDKLGLVSGANCFIWESFEQLVEIIDKLPSFNHGVRLGAANLALAHHTWNSRIGSLMTMVDMVRRA